MAARITFADLIGEAEPLTRRCLHLVADTAARQSPIAVWGGSGPAAAPRRAGAHLLTLASTRLPRLPELTFPGPCISVYRSAKGEEPAVSVHRDDILPLLLITGSGTPLTARAATSLPPLDAIFRFGSPR
ncbi:MAG TPA: hypothetical protein VG106_13250, partial [Vicinamibacterales bacterium]|nr:hypothetical protein [Vicinamibacterales bacterium]